jgi:hypothetical protein
MITGYSRELATAQRVERTAAEAALLAHRCHTAKLPPDEWIKRLMSMALQVAHTSVMSVGEALDSILSALDHANALTAKRASAIITKLEIASVDWDAMPTKPRPKRFRGKQLAKWPYGWKR